MGESKEGLPRKKAMEGQVPLEKGLKGTNDPTKP